MEDKVYRYVRQHHMVSAGEKVLVGVSGGADSTCLLLVLAALAERLRIRLAVIHVNHNLRGEESMEDQRFVEALCRSLSVECVTRSVDVERYVRENGASEEEGARTLRYRAFHAAAKELSCDKIAVAHHGDDQAETVLMNLFRGSSLRGLGGIRPVRDRVIRPLLCSSRREIETYLELRGAPYRQDSSNENVAYSRNRIRLQLMPFLQEKVNPRVVEHVNAIAEDAAQAEEYLMGVAARMAESYVEEKNGQVLLDLRVLEEQEAVIASRILRICLEKSGSPLKDVGRIHLQELMRLAGLETGREVFLPYGVKARKEYDRIRFLRGDEGIPGETTEEVVIRKEQVLSAPDGLCVGIGHKTFSFRVKKNDKNVKYEKKAYTKCFDYDTIQDVFSLRTRRSGDYVVVNEAGGRKKLKDYFIDEKIPRTERDEILLVTEGAHVSWIVGYRMSEDRKITDGTRLILEITVDGG